MSLIAQMQRAETQVLHDYNQTMVQTELRMMPEWFISTHLGIALTAEQSDAVNRVFNAITHQFVEQPQTFVHNGTLWHTLVHCDTPRHTVAHRGTPWHTVVDCCTPWHTVTHPGTLTETLAHCGTPWYTVAHPGTQ